MRAMITSRIVFVLVGVGSFAARVVVKTRDGRAHLGHYLQYHGAASTAPG